MGSSTKKMWGVSGQTSEKKGMQKQSSSIKLAPCAFSLAVEDARSRGDGRSPCIPPVPCSTYRSNSAGWFTPPLLPVISYLLQLSSGALSCCPVLFRRLECSKRQCFLQVNGFGCKTRGCHQVWLLLRCWILLQAWGHPHP